MSAARENCLVTAALLRVAVVYAEDLDAEAERFCEITRPDWNGEAR